MNKNYQELKIYKGQTPYNIWYAVKNPKGRFLFLCFYAVSPVPKINFTPTHCVPNQDMQETSWLDLLVVRGITKDQVIEWIEKESGYMWDCEGDGPPMPSNLDGENGTYNL